MSLYKKLLDALTLRDIDELGLIPSTPELTELPQDSQAYHPIVVVESKLGLSLEHWPTLLEEAHQQFLDARESNDTRWIEQASRIMIVLKPDNITAMNARKNLIASKVVDPKEELKLLELIFTIPRHAKSGIAWSHRLWVYEAIHGEQGGDILDHMDLEKELALCARAATIYPRNYYAWQHRQWILKNMTTSDSLRFEYEQTCRWVETNVSDYSGQHHLSLVISALKDHGAEIDITKHLDWVEALMTRFPGHESLWYHRRNCYATLITTKTSKERLSVNDEHTFIEKCVHSAESKRRQTSVQDEQEFLRKQILFAYRYGYWLCIKNKDSLKRDEYASRLAAIGCIVPIDEINSGLA